MCSSSSSQRFTVRQRFPTLRPSTTLAPCAESSRAVALPSPLLAPVMTTTFPSMFLLILLTSACSDSRSDVLLQARELRGTRNRHDPGLLGKQPGERDLRRGRLLAFCDLAKQIDQGLIRFPSLWRKARDDVAEVGMVERGVFVDLSREEALAERAKWNEGDSELLEGR